MGPEATGAYSAQSLRMNDISSDNNAIKHFVREALGCGCPDEVFDDIRISVRSDLFDTDATVYEIGARLLVAVFTPVEWRNLRSKLGHILDAGKQYRDRRGYNRFRLVIVTDDEEAAGTLVPAFRSLQNIDERVHLHVIDPQALPGNVAEQPD